MKLDIKSIFIALVYSFVVLTSASLFLINIGMAGYHNGWLLFVVVISIYFLGMALSYFSGRDRCVDNDKPILDLCIIYVFFLLRLACDLEFLSKYAGIVLLNKSEFLSGWGTTWVFMAGISLVQCFKRGIPLTGRRGIKGWFTSEKKPPLDKDNANE